MEVVHIFNQSILVADIAAFVANWILPAVSGVFVSWFTNRWKLQIPFDVPDQIRVRLIRVFVAVLCTGLNLVGQWLMTDSVFDASTIPTLFYAYATAAAAYDNYFKRK